MDPTVELIIDRGAPYSGAPGNEYEVTFPNGQIHRVSALSEAEAIKKASERRSIIVGALVRVGPAYRMADKPPYAGKGEYVTDAWTSMHLKVLTLDDWCAGLGPVDSIDEDDVSVWVHVARLIVE